MLTKEDAIEKVEAFLRKVERYVDGGLVLVPERTLTRTYGWVFFYTSRRYAETGDRKHAIAGNGPVVVVAATGEVEPLGTASPPDEELADFERERGLPSA